MAGDRRIVVAMTFTTPAPRCPCGDVAKGIVSALLDSGDLVTWSLCDPCAHREILVASATMIRFGDGTLVERVTAEHWQLAGCEPMRS